MAYDKVVDSAKLDADLTMVADAIRNSGVTDEVLSFPNGFEGSVEAITDFMLKWASRYAEDYHGAFFPKGITVIGNYAFSNCQRFYFPNTLSEGITHIGNFGLSNCYRFYNLVLPASLLSLADSSFQNCLNLESVTFKGTPNTIHAKVFTSCDKLTVINVPWAEGAVANAPWGATNATSNYNYTGEG